MTIRKRLLRKQDSRIPTLKQISDYLYNLRRKAGNTYKIEDIERYVSDHKYENISSGQESFFFGENLTKITDIRYKYESAVQYTIDIWKWSCALVNSRKFANCASITQSLLYLKKFLFLECLSLEFCFPRQEKECKCQMTKMRIVKDRSIG